MEWDRRGWVKGERKTHERLGSEKEERLAPVVNEIETESKPEVLFLTAIDMIPSYENKLRTVRGMRRYARKKVHMPPSFTWSKCNRKMLLSMWKYQNYFRVIVGWRVTSVVRWHLFELLAKRFRPKINCRRVEWTRFTIEIDRLAIFIVQIGRPIEDKTD